MKKAVVAAILGIVAVGSTYGQGQLAIANYLAAPYNQVFWDPLTPGVGNQAVRVNTVQVQVWFGEGNIVDQNLLNLGITLDMAISGGSFNFNPGLGHGNGGYFIGAIQGLPSWAPGELFTFQLRAIGNGAGGPVDTQLSRSALWTQQSEIGSSSNPANPASFVPGLAVVVPEPSTLALAGLGSAALLIFRRRRS